MYKDPPAKKDFDISNEECGRWKIVFSFQANGGTSSFETYDFWVRQDGGGQNVPFAEIEYTGKVPKSNSSSLNVNMKSVKLYTLPDKDIKGKDNIVIRWDPNNPAF